MSKELLKIDRSLRLPSDQYFQKAYQKKQLYVHHTVGGSARSSFEYWLGKPEKVGTAYLIDRNGTIFEVFDPRYWCHHLGLEHKRNEEFNQESIGIEIASEGALKMVHGVMRAFDGKAIFKDGYVDNQTMWRGFQYFDLYEPVQIDSLYALVEHLCEQHSIPKKCIPQSEAMTFSEKYFDFNGILGHCNVRADKTDPHPKFRFDQLQAYLDGVDRGQAIPLP